MVITEDEQVLWVQKSGCPRVTAVMVLIGEVAGMVLEGLDGPALWVVWVMASLWHPAKWALLMSQVVSIMCGPIKSSTALSVLPILLLLQPTGQ